MATMTMNYGAWTIITITAASLANSSSRQSAVVDNSTNKYIDAIVQIYGSSGTAGPVDVYVYSAFDGTSYTDGCTGSDAAFTMPTNKNLKQIGRWNAPTSAATSHGMSVAAAFGGVMPEKWGIVLQNSSGGTLGGTVTVKYQGIKIDVA